MIDTYPLECFESIKDFGLMIVDADGIIKFYSKGCELIEGFTKDEVLGKLPTEIYNTNYPDSVDGKDIYKDVRGKSIILNTVQTGKVYKNFFCYYKTSKGAYCNIILNSFPIYGDDGKIQYAVQTYREISDYLNLISIINKQAIDLKKLSRKNLKNGTQYTFEDVIGSSRKIKNCIKKAKIAADTYEPVLISGVTGTGKEVFAQSIHNASRLKDKPFIAVNCSAIPETLLESTLFGITHGSFTGAKEKEGLLSAAKGGTLFLDELNSMNLALQSKLLRVIEMKKYMKVGGVKELDADVRIIGAINEDPETAIKENRLRSDLFYRLAVFYVHIPPLKERAEDVLQISKYFLNEASVYLNKKMMDLADGTKNVFLDYHWPGNIRELKHIITQSAYMADSDAKLLYEEYLPQHFIETKKDVGHKSYQVKDLESTESKSLREHLDTVEKEIIIDTLKKNNNNITKTAGQLKISRQNLQNKLRKYKMR